MSNVFDDFPKLPQKIIICLLTVMYVSFWYSYVCHLLKRLFLKFNALFDHWLIPYGSFYNSFVVPILVLLVYSWKNRRSFVETKLYMVLKTKIHEVCKNRKKEENKSNTSIHTYIHTFTFISAR